MNHSNDASDGPRRDRRFDFALLGFLAIAAFLLLTEHRAHAFGVLLFGLLLLCPLLHQFMHGGLGGGDDAQHRHAGGRDGLDNLEGRWRND